MKFEKLTDTKIKIILSIQDIESNNLSIENILSNSDDSQKLLDSIIHKAEIELGFTPDDSQLLVETVMQSNNECVFTITKLSNDKTFQFQHSNSFVFKFDFFDDFINLCTFLNNFSCLCLKEISKKFSLIYYKNAYYLKFNKNENTSIVIDYMKTLFEEFGTDVSYSTEIIGILNEYGKTIFSQNAILKCAQAFIK